PGRSGFLFALPLEQIWSPSRCATNRLLAPPRIDLRVVAAQQDLGHLEAAELRGPGVVGVFDSRERGVGMRFVEDAGLGNDPWNEPDDRIGDDHRRQFAARQDIVADRQLVRPEYLGDALVDAFVVPANERDPPLLRQLLRDALRELPSARRHDRDMGVLKIVAEDGFDRFHDRRGFHDHPGAAAVGRVVGGAMPIVGPVADVMNLDVDQPLRPGTLDDAFAENAIEHAGEQREDIDAERGYRIAHGRRSSAPKTHGATSPMWWTVWSGSVSISRSTSGSDFPFANQTARIPASFAAHTSHFSESPT